jgi:hypothetical protein
MTLGQANNQVKWLRILSIMIAIVVTLLFTGAILKSLYSAMDGDSSIFSVITQVVQEAIYLVYEKTQWASLIWKWSPTINPNELNSSGNCGFLFIVCCGVVARMIWDSTSCLSARIKKTILRVEELKWEQSLLEQEGIYLGANKQDILQINIGTERKDQWFKRPLGIIVIGVTVAVLAQWANLTFGLTKI